MVVAARWPDKAADLGYPVMHFDYDRYQTVAPALAGVDRQFIVTGYTADMLRHSKVLIDQAKSRIGTRLMTRITLHARHSTEHQRETSIEDQLRICHERAKREAWDVVATHKTPAFRVRA